MWDLWLSHFYKFLNSYNSSHSWAIPLMFFMFPVFTNPVTVMFRSIWRFFRVKSPLSKYRKRMTRSKKEQLTFYIVSQNHEQKIKVKTFNSCTVAITASIFLWTFNFGINLSRIVLCWLVTLIVCFITVKNVKGEINFRIWIRMLSIYREYAKVWKVLFTPIYINTGSTLTPSSR